MGIWILSKRLCRGAGQTGTLDLDTLESHLWEAADILRGSIDAADYKNYIFGLLFLKRINDDSMRKATDM